MRNKRISQKFTYVYSKPKVMNKKTSIEQLIAENVKKYLLLTKNDISSLTV